MKNSSVIKLKLNKKKMRTYIQLLFQAATESFSIHGTENNNVLTILAIFNSSEEWTIKKKSRNKLPFE